MSMKLQYASFLIPLYPDSSEQEVLNRFIRGRRVYAYNTFTKSGNGRGMGIGRRETNEGMTSRGGAEQRGAHGSIKRQMQGGF